MPEVFCVPRRTLCSPLCMCLAWSKMARFGSGRAACIRGRFAGLVQGSPAGLSGRKHSSVVRRANTKYPPPAALRGVPSESQAARRAAPTCPKDRQEQKFVGERRIAPRTHVSTFGEHTARRCDGELIHLPHEVAGAYSWRNALLTAELLHLPGKPAGAARKPTLASSLSIFCSCLSFGLVGPDCGSWDQKAHGITVSLPYSQPLLGRYQNSWAFGVDGMADRKDALRL